MDNVIKLGMMKYCVIGNIVMEHLDENGVLRYGTASFPGGRKVYISRRLWDNGVAVIGLNRHKSRYATETVPRLFRWRGLRIFVFQRFSIHQCWSL